MTQHPIDCVLYGGAQCVTVLIMGAVRTEWFCDGALLGFFKDGSIRKLLEIERA